MNNKSGVLQSVNYVEKLLGRFKRVLNGGHDTFSTVELSDLSDILGYTEDEIVELVKACK